MSLRRGGVHGCHTAAAALLLLLLACPRDALAANGGSRSTTSTWTRSATARSIPGHRSRRTATGSESSRPDACSISAAPWTSPSALCAGAPMVSGAIRRDREAAHAHYPGRGRKVGRAVLRRRRLQHHHARAGGRPGQHPGDLPGRRKLQDQPERRLALQPSQRTALGHLGRQLRLERERQDLADRRGVRAALPQRSRTNRTPTIRGHSSRSGSSPTRISTST